MSDPVVDPRGRQPFSYSWVILATGFCIMVLSSGLNMSFGVFVRTLINDYGWTTSIVTYGWKDSYIILGLMAWGIALSAFALLRNDPQDIGARLYGEAVDGADPSPAGRAPVLTGTPAKL